MASPEQEQAAAKALQTAIENTLGYQFIGFTMTTALYGVTVVQTYLYFRSYTRNDRIYTKLVVLLLLTLDTFIQALITHALYQVLIIQWGNVPSLAFYPWTFGLENGITVIITVIVQLFFASRVWLVGGAARWSFYPIAITALMAFASGLAITIKIMESKEVESLNSRFITVACALDQGLASLCDILITLALCIYLRFNRSWVSQQTTTLLDHLFTYILGRGILTAVVQVIALITFVVVKDKEVWMLSHLILSKVYINSMLVLINGRTTPSSVVEPRTRSDINFIVPGTMQSNSQDDSEPSQMGTLPIDGSTKKYESSASAIISSKGSQQA